MGLERVTQGQSNNLSNAAGSGLATLAAGAPQRKQPNSVLKQQTAELQRKQADSMTTIRSAKVAAMTVGTNESKKLVYEAVRELLVGLLGVFTRSVKLDSSSALAMQTPVPQATQPILESSGSSTPSAAVSAVFEQSLLTPATAERRLLINPAETPQLVPNAEPLPYVTGYVATPLRAAEIVKVGGNNFLIPAWQAEVVDAAIRNGGLGNETDGYLAWSKEGFVRLKNPFLSDEGNQRIASLSLQLGMEVERLPVAKIRSEEDAVEGAKSVARLLTDYDTELRTFLQDPKEGIRLASGRRRFGISVTTDGVPLSYYYKKDSGWSSFGKRALGVAATAFDYASGTAILRLAGRSLFGDQFLKNEIVERALSQDPFYLTSRLAEGYANDTLETRDLVSSVIAAGATTAHIAGYVVPGLQPVSTAINVVQLVAEPALSEGALG